MIVAKCGDVMYFANTFGLALLAAMVICLSLRIQQVMLPPAAASQRHYPVQSHILAFIHTYMYLVQEEGMLSNHFGAEWTQYASNRKRLIPYVI